MALNIYQQRESGCITFVPRGKAPTGLLHVKAKPLPSLPENKLVNFCRVLWKTPSAVKWPGLEEVPHGYQEEKRPVGARVCRLHSKFHDCLRELCFLIYKSCQRNGLNGATRWPWILPFTSRSPLWRAFVRRMGGCEGVKPGKGESQSNPWLSWPSIYLLSEVRGRPSHLGLLKGPEV